MTTEFWSQKRVFITGHTGFKGSWLSLWLAQLGATVKGYALEPPTSPNMFSAAKIAELAETEINDIRDKAALQRSIAEFKPDIVFHMAAQALVRESYRTPVETFEANVMGTVNVLEAVRTVDSVKAIIVITSDKCYENKEWHWGYREDEPMGGHDAYSASKACAELVASSYRRSFFQQVGSNGLCAVASARAGNVIGGGDWAADRLVPDTLKQLAIGESVLVRSPGAVRPWQHVLEPLSGYVLLGQSLLESGQQYAEAWNFGPNDEGAKPVSWVVKELIKQWGAGQWHTSDTIQPHEATYLKLDCSKARERLKWNAVWNPVEALAATVQWHKAWLSDADMRAVSLADIARFQRSAQRLESLSNTQLELEPSAS